MSKSAKTCLLIIAIAALTHAETGVATPTNTEATISSDQMELLQNGKVTVFSGHVVLEKKLGRLRADRMTRLEDGSVVAEGRIITTWADEKGSRVEARGQKGRYSPATESAELWNVSGKKISVHWRDARGSASFQSKRGILFFAPKRAQLVGAVTGHIIPAAK